MKTETVEIAKKMFWSGVVFLAGLFASLMKTETVEIAKKMFWPGVVFLAGLFASLEWNMGIWPTMIGVVMALMTFVFTRHMGKNEKKFFSNLALCGFLAPAIMLAGFLYVAVHVTS